MKWYSEGRKAHVDVDAMGLFHARAALAKLERGDYLDVTGNPPSAGEHLELRSALQARISQLDEQQAAASGGPDV